MRVLMLTHNMAGLGGSFQRAWSMARGLAEWGVEVTLLASRRSPGLQRIASDVSGIRVIEMGDLFPERLRHGGLSPMDVARRLGFVRSHGYDLVHSFDHRPAVSLPALAARRRWGIPYVADWADLWGKGGIADERRGPPGRLLARLDDSWESHVHAAADAATVISSYLEARVRELGIPPDRVCRVAVGANTDVIRPRAKDEMRRKYGVPLEARVLVHAGFAPYDRDMLMETLKHLAASEPAALLLLTGGESIPVMRAVEQAGLAGMVRPFGVVPYEDLGDILACGDVMLLPFRDRPLNAARFPNRFGDYLAAGRPIATNPTGDLGEVVERERIGIVAPAEPRAFAEAILRLLDDPPLCEAMGRRARALAETRYSWHSLVEPLYNVYQLLVGTASRRARA